MVLIAIYPQCSVTSVLISHNGLKRHLLRKSIRLIYGIGSSPIHGFMKLLHSLGRQLDIAVVELAVLQIFEIVRSDCELTQIGKLRWIAESLNREITREFSE